MELPVFFSQHKFNQNISINLEKLCKNITYLLIPLILTQYLKVLKKTNIKTKANNKIKLQLYVKESSNCT